MKYLLGIDNGGTFCKAVIFNVLGDEISHGFSPTILEKNNNNFQERALSTLWKANVDAIKMALYKSNISPSDILAVSFSGHGKGLYLLDKNGNDLYKGILSTDSRASSILKDLIANNVDKEFFNITYQNPLACHPAVLLKWLKKYKNDIYKQIGSILSVKDYIRYKLTKTVYTEYTDGSSNGLLNLKTKDYDANILKIFNIQELEKALPPLKNSYDIAGYVTKEASEETGLAKGTPVILGAFDINACGIASGMFTEEHLCMIAGTWSINEYISKNPVLNADTTLNSLYCLNEYYLIEESSPTSAGNLEWYINNMLNTKISYKETNDIVSKNYSNNSLYYLPYIDGNNINPSAKGAIIGMTRQTTYQDIIRAIYEGVGFSHAMHIEKLLKHREKPKKIQLAGGAAKSEIWTQIFADIINIPIETVTTKELGAYGACILSCIGLGMYKSNEDIMKSIKVNKIYYPNSKYRNIYKDKLNQFQNLANIINKI